MHAHIHLHLDHNHGGLFSRVTRDIGSALDWITGPAMSSQERLKRAQAEVRSNKSGYGIL